MAKVEGIPEQMDRRLNLIESRLSWTLGTMITMWISITGLLVMVLVRMG